MELFEEYLDLRSQEVHNFQLYNVFAWFQCGIFLMIDRLINWSIHWSTVWLIDRLIDRLVDRLIDRLIDWLICLSIGCICEYYLIFCFPLQTVDEPFVAPLHASRGHPFNETSRQNVINWLFEVSSDAYVQNLVLHQAIMLLDAVGPFLFLDDAPDCKPYHVVQLMAICCVNAMQYVEVTVTVSKTSGVNIKRFWFGHVPVFSGQQFLLLFLPLFSPEKYMLISRISSSKFRRPCRLCTTSRW